MPATHPTRRDFFRTTAAGAVGLTLAASASGGSRPPLAIGKAKSCIFINMVGGPAHLDTFDPKPNAPSDVRGPFSPIQTKVPGLHLSELFPKLAAVSDKFALVRSMHHDAPPVHESGFQLLNTGRLFRDGPEWPSAGAVVSRLTHRSSTVIADAAQIDTGIAVSHGQGRGWIENAWAPDVDIFEWPSSLGEKLNYATKLIEIGWLFATVNMYSTVFDAPSWDCHADGGSLRTTLADVRNIVAPSFDTAVAQLLTDLEERGLLESTLVVATGEFGRTPKLNSNGGRDHWAGCWTALVAGGGVKGGQVIGASDATGCEPAERPVTPQELVSTVFHALGVPHNATIPGPDGTSVNVYPGTPVAELF
ncbi:hypothetical protein GobsT_73140 [Gemmata obscuriglobus]|uniref:DUF1501 domain-containing protein n=1 Tax=Gemmata obscuriglobus TaxID=114 RepID=A0A2Z3HDF7_9BACT|nr:DUF1501 domain-containing protein [Gemmata obscuriglobus]AWM41617.1 DUF1501 domain-containing protein [Gemmata obscuriglobus]QEG32459.1 hypothetical protein GobsT_73140 [Gemmata obscuriglobus]VTS11815.1 protein containing duf1501 : Uncharacterized protein OS=Singulisphaera acidiphila (strain ATCC BAA-1392 / DSM 18658 / VKM B-2454 / MOB10) GN=Sinac_5270 PE=4 SV=1: DUF1501: DUF1501 [Gemmata obscuriglobus UQM 2246]